MTRRTRLQFTAFGVVLYVAALLLPAGAVSLEGTILGEFAPMYGWELHEFGGISLWQHLKGNEGFPILYDVIWLASPFLWLAWACLASRWHRIAVIAAATSLLLMLPMFVQLTIRVFNQPGFWCWLLSASWTTLLAVKAVIQKAAVPREPQMH